VGNIRLAPQAPTDSKRPVSALSAEAGAPDVEVTPAMIEAGVAAFYEEAVCGWDNPGTNDVKRVLAAVFAAMSQTQALDAGPKSELEAIAVFREK
jgi:hypothetical protein